MLFLSTIKSINLIIHKCEKNKPLQYYIDKYCKTKNPIIYNIVYTGPNEQIISDLHETKLTKIFIH